MFSRSRTSGSINAVAITKSWVEVVEEKEYIEITMSNAARNEIQQEVINYLKTKTDPVKVSSMVSDLHRDRGVPESDLRSVVQPMIVTGKLNYASGLKIKLAKASD